MDYKRIIEMLKLQIDYGKRRGESIDEWVLKKRTINTAFAVINMICGMNFVDFESAIYLHSRDKKISYFITQYEKQMEEAILAPESFIRNLPVFYIKMADYILRQDLFMIFLEFYEYFSFKCRSKIEAGYKNVFEAYVSLILQQFPYFCSGHSEYNVIGYTGDGQPFLQKSIFPYSDCGNYELEKKMLYMLYGKKELSTQDIHKAFRLWGYDVHSFEEIALLEAKVKVFDNNHYALLPYITENNVDILPKEPFRHIPVHFPRKWKPTGFYVEELSRRIRMLPDTGITALFVNASDIEKINFKEIFHNDSIILLYRVCTKMSGEFSGFFNTRTHMFYSIFENTNFAETHDSVENFILENYYFLTCNFIINRKKNYAMRQVENLEKEFYYPEQPLVKYQYQRKKQPGTQGTFKNYNKNTYVMERKSVSGYIRKLPDNQHASNEAIAYAQQLGYDLPLDMTYVRPFQKYVRRLNHKTEMNT